MAIDDRLSNMYNLRVIDIVEVWNAAMSAKAIVLDCGSICSGYSSIWNIFIYTKREYRSCMANLMFLIKLIELGCL